MFHSQGQLLGVRLTVLISLLHPVAAQAQSKGGANQPGQAWSAVFLEYQHAAEPMLGVTVALNHYDRAYPDWGYYLGYAKSKQQPLPVAPPGQAKQDLSMLKLGLSYSLSKDFSLYGGGAMLERRSESTNGITPLCSDCQPAWQTDADKSWGGELGLRYAPSRHLIIGLGYNSSTQGGVFSIGYRG